jgi:hypothetical protein
MSNLAATAISGAITAASMAAAVVVPSPDTWTLAGTGLAAVWVVMETSVDNKDGRPRNISVVACKFISAVVCGFGGPGLLHRLFADNETVRNLETLREAWFLSAFACGMFGWGAIWTARKIWKRALYKAEHNRWVDGFLGTDTDTKRVPEGTVTTTTTTTTDGGKTQRP